MNEMIQNFNLASDAFYRNPFPTYRAMRARGPVVSTKLPLVGEMKVTTTYDAAEFVLKNSDVLSVDTSMARLGFLATVFKVAPRGIRLLGKNMLTMDDPEHRRLRKLVDSAFRRKEIESWRPRIEKVTMRQFDELYASDDADLVKHVTRDLPLSVICELLGLPDADRPQFKDWMQGISKVSGPADLIKLFSVLNKLAGYLEGQFEIKRANPEDDLISKLVISEVGGDRMTHDDLISTCLLLFIAGHETTTNLISGGVIALLRNPEQLQRLRDDPTLDANATEEMLRYVSPVQMTKPRTALEDVDFLGMPLKKGQTVMAHVGAANTDPAHFADAEKFDVGRENVRHLGFGGGIHLCLGNWLARAEMQICTRALLERSPNLALGVPESDLRWQERLAHSSIEALPLKL